MFDKLIWKSDRLLIDELVFRLQLSSNENWELGNNCFVLFKDKQLVNQYERFFMPRPDFRVTNFFELGIYDGGSLAFWFECFHPRKIVGIDIDNREDSDYFRQYVRTRDLEDRIRTYWRVDQGDANRLREIVKAEFDNPLDMVVDDASHQYALTKASFETLFPMLRPGGLYFIEDWAWAHWQAWQAPDHPWAGNIELTRLVFDLVETVGTSAELINSLMIFRGFAAVERGPALLDPGTSLNLENQIIRRPKSLTTDQTARIHVSWLRRAYYRLRSLL